MITQSRIIISALLSTVILTGCDPKETYKNVILDEGYIPYEHPTDYAGAGVIQFQQKKNPSNVIAAADRARCFDTDRSLWHETNIDLADRRTGFTLNFDAAANSILIAGNTQLSLNLGAKFVREMDVTFSDAKLEEVGTFALQDFYQQSMSERCKKALEKYPFTFKALKVGSMSFVFKKEGGGHINLDAKVVNQILNIKGDVQWEIINDYILTVKTPKYIGYQMARFKNDGSGQIEKLAADYDARGFWRFLPFDPAFLFTSAMNR